MRFKLLFFKHILIHTFGLGLLLFLCATFEIRNLFWPGFVVRKICLSLKLNHHFKLSLLKFGDTLDQWLYTEIPERGARGSASYHIYVINRPILITTVGVPPNIQLGPRHTQYFCTQYCNKKIKR
jgi:hypothetical protein